MWSNLCGCSHNHCLYWEEGGGEDEGGEGKCQWCDSPFIVSVVATTSVLLYRTVVVSLLIVATEGGEEEGRRGSDVHLW